MYKAHGNVTRQCDPYEYDVYLRYKCSDCGGLFFEYVDGLGGYWENAIPECLHTNVLDLLPLRKAE